MARTGEWRVTRNRPLEIMQIAGMILIFSLIAMAWIVFAVVLTHFVVKFW